MKKTKTIIQARSKKNGIVFYSNTFPLVGIETFFDDSGKVQSRLIPTHLDEVIDYLGRLNEKESKFKKRNVIIFDLVLIIISVIVFAFTKNFRFVMASIYFSVTVSFDLFRVIESSYKMKLKSENGHSTAKFHAAEHMAINAYEKLQRVPTLQEIKKFSRFSKDCGSRIILSRIFMLSMISLAMAFLSGDNGLLYLLVILLITLFMIFAVAKGWLVFLQVFITTKPSDDEIELAIEGLKEFENMEERLEKKEYSIIMEMLDNICLYHKF